MMHRQAACAGHIACARQRFVPAFDPGDRRACDDHASACIERQMIWMHAHASASRHQLTHLPANAKPPACFSD
ncbi:UNVERIFIED_CONTAM: hypothetical protein EX528_05965 [Xanthomonas axonopodis]|nr:hypothetical protein CDO09_15695 [Xanthomonas perforans]